MFKHIFREIFQIPLCEEITALKILTTAYNSLYEKIFSPILFPRIVLCTCMRRLRTPFRPSIFTISYESAMKVNLYYQAYFYKWHVWLFTFVSLIQIKIAKVVFFIVLLDFKQVLISSAKYIHDSLSLFMRNLCGA